MSHVLVDISRRLKGVEDGASRLRIGHVTATSPLQVSLGGAGQSLPAARLTSYTPSNGDRVAVIASGPSLLVLGKVAS